MRQIHEFDDDEDRGYKRLPPGMNFVKDTDVYLFGGINDSVMKWVLPELHDILNEGMNQKNARVMFHINSYGGSADVCKEVVTWMEMAKALDITICTQVFSRAYSAASVIAAAGTRGHRFISCFGEHLCHLGSVDMGKLSNDVEAARANETVRRHFNFVRNCYKKYAKIKNLDKVIHDEGLIFTGEETIQNGLADELTF